MSRSLCTFFLLLSLAANAQEVHRQGLYWIRYQAHIDLSTKVYWMNEIDNRRFFNPDVQNQFIFHSRIHYRYGLWDFGAGLTSSWGFAQIPQNGYEASTPEIRPVAELSHETLFGKLILLNRIRTDHRFFEAGEGESIWEHSRYVLRFRYRIQAKIPIRNAPDKKSISFRLAEEIMLNSKENTFDQNRIYATWEFYLNRSFSLEAGYIFIYQQRFGGDDFFSRHVMRFSILQKIDLTRH